MRKFVLAIAMVLAFVMASTSLVAAQTTYKQSYFDRANNTYHGIVDFNPLKNLNPADSTGVELIGDLRPQFDPPLPPIKVYTYTVAGTKIMIDESLYKLIVENRDGKLVFNLDKIKEVKIWGMFHYYGEVSGDKYPYGNYLGWPNGKRDGKGYKAREISENVWEIVVNIKPDDFNQITSVEQNAEINGNSRIWSAGPGYYTCINSDTGNPEFRK